MNMLKYIYLAAALVLSTPTYGNTVETCYVYSEIVLNTAHLRDQGLTPKEVLEVLLRVGMPLEVAKTLLVYVYAVGAKVGPEELQVNFMNTCVGNQA